MSRKYIGKIYQYDSRDNFVAEFEGELENIFKNMENGDKYYYRFPCFADVGKRTREKYKHFGVNVIDVNGKEYSPEELVNRSLNHHIQKYYRRKRLHKTYHLNFENHLFIYAWQLEMNELLAGNIKEEFNSKLDAFLDRHKEFVQISDLNPYKTVIGLYLVVLDEYNVCYIGQT